MSNPDQSIREWRIDGRFGVETQQFSSIHGLPLQLLRLRMHPLHVFGHPSATVNTAVTQSRKQLHKQGLSEPPLKNGKHKFQQSHSPSPY